MQKFSCAVANYRPELHITGPYDCSVFPVLENVAKSERKFFFDARTHAFDRINFCSASLTVDGPHSK